MRKVEEMIETGSAPYPVERTLLVSGMLESCLDSKIQGSRAIETPHLDVRYLSPPTLAVLPDVTATIDLLGSAPRSGRGIVWFAAWCFRSPSPGFSAVHLTCESAT